MPPNDSSSDLDSRIAAIVESTVGRMRDELLRRVEDTEARLRDITDRMAGEAPEPPPAPAPAPVAADELSDLFDSVVAIDRGGSQQDVLAALLEGAGKFASRAALFLTRADGAQGWGSYGFEETAGEIQEVQLSYAEGPLATLAEGRGCIGLDGDDCRDLGDRMGVSPGAEGLLVPFVLRDRLAAALYVDRLASDPPLGRRPLQLLTYAGAQAVEGLALRQRGETPTLQIAAEAVAAPEVVLWEGPSAAPPAAEPVTEELPTEEPVTEELATEEPSVAAPPAVEEPSAVEPAATEPALSEPQITEEVSLEELAEEEPSVMVTEAAPPAEPEVEPVRDSEWQAPAPEEPAETLTVPSEEPMQPPMAPAGPVVAEPPEEPPPAAESVDAGVSTVDIEAMPEAPAVTPPAGDQAASAGGTTEVSPPTDVTGPGWAFTASRAAAESGDDAQHEEARRLARLLVTEIKLYNEEQVEEGRRTNDIYARLREDIDRSRQIFNERVDEAVRRETDYFHEEMIRILAGGNAEALGL